MTNWILIAAVAYVLFAVNGVIDKILLTNVVRKPFVYIFYNGMLAPVVLLLVPFGVSLISFPYFVLAMFAGACFTAALYFYYTSVQRISISRVLPIQGGFVPLFTLALAAVILGEKLNEMQLIAFAFLTAGAVLVSFKRSDGAWKLPSLQYSLVAAFLFAMHFVLTKMVYEQTGFVNGLFWTRWGMFLFAMMGLIMKDNRREVLAAPAQTSNQNKGLFYVARGAGGLGGLLQNYAISLGSVTIVNAMQSVQFTFVLLISTFISVRYPQLFKEMISKNIIAQKIGAIILVVLGLTILGYAS